MGPLEPANGDESPVLVAGVGQLPGELPVLPGDAVQR